MKIYGEKIKSARIYRALSVSELARELKISAQTLCQYENDIIKPEPEILFKLISILKFPSSHFTQEDKYKIKIKNTFFRAHLLHPHLLNDEDEL